MDRGKGVLWFVYICVLGIGFSKTTASLTRMMGLSVTAYFLLTALLIIAVLLLFYLPGKLLAGKLGLNGAGHRRSDAGQPRGDGRIGLSDWAFAVLLLGALVGVRCFLAPVSGSSAGQTAFDQALSRGALPDMSLSGLYVRLLSWSLRFFSEGGAVLTCNLILQTAGSFFLYFGIRLLAGADSAKAALVFVIFLPVFHNSAFMAEPQSLLLFLAGLLLFGCALCFRRSCRMPAARVRALPGAFAGLCCGAAGFVHVLLCSLALLYGAKLLHFRKKKGFFRAFLCFLCAFGAGFALFMGLEGLQSGLDMGETGRLWLLRGMSREYDALLHSPGLSDYWLTIPAYLLSFLAVFGLLDGKQDGKEDWIVPFVWTAAAELCGAAPLQEQGMRFIFLGVMAGFGIGQTLYASKAEEKRGGQEEKDGWAVDVASPMMLAFVDDFEEDGDAAMDERADVRKAETKEEQGRQDGAKKPGSWLDNPLPVPKRHVKKEMTYAFEPDPDQMFYDIPVSELDDFDI